MRTMSACCLTSWAKLSDMQKGRCCLKLDWLLSSEKVAGLEWRVRCFLYFNGGILNGNVGVVRRHEFEFRRMRRIADLRTTLLGFLYKFATSRNWGSRRRSVGLVPRNFCARNTRERMIDADLEGNGPCCLWMDDCDGSRLLCGFFRCHGACGWCATDASGSRAVCCGSHESEPHLPAHDCTGADGAVSEVL